MITGQVKNENNLRKISERLDDIDGKLFAQKMQMVLSIKQAVEMELSALLGDKMKHFGVSIGNNGMNYTVKILFTDDAGKYIYYGTEPHTIRSSGTAMPIGSGRYAQSVQHPGSKGMKKEIDEAIGRGVLIGKSVSGNMRGKI